MSWTKRQYITAAFEEIGLASYVFDLQPEDLQSALRRLDAMMGQWNAKGLRLRYPLQPNQEDSELDEVTEIPDMATEAIITNLALRIAPSYGKETSAHTRMVAKEAYNSLVSYFSQPINIDAIKPPNPIGAGNKPWRYRGALVQEVTDPLAVGNDGILEL